jgi:uncharacterized protein
LPLQGAPVFEFLKKIMPKEEKFFDLFERHAAILKAGAATLRAVLEGGPKTAENCALLMKQEDAADGVTRETLEAIRKSFITPFDRSDIQNLITSMDDAIDQMNKTVKAIILFEVKSFEPDMREMADEIVKLAELTGVAVPLLRAVNANSQELHRLTGAIVNLEEESDRVHDAGLKALLKGKARKDAMAFIIGAEIYGHLEKVADRFEDVANVISGIVIEHV